MQAALFCNERFEPQTRFEFGEGVEVRLPVAKADARKALLVFEGRGKANGRKVTYGPAASVEQAREYARQFNARQEKLNGDYRMRVEVGFYADYAKEAAERPAPTASAPAPEVKVEATVEEPKQEPQAAPVKVPAGIGYATSAMAKIPAAQPIRDTAAAILLAIGNGDARMQVWIPKAQVGVTTDPSVGVTFYVRKAWLTRENLWSLAR